MILLACAHESELSFWQAREGVATLVMGVGPIEAACAVTRELAGGRYRLVINAGIGGAFDGAASIGDGVVVAHDAMELGLEDGQPLSLPGGEKVVDRASSDGDLVGRMRERGFRALRGITVARVTSTESTAHRLATNLDAQVESMEGFSVLRAAELAGVPAIELRGISNRCGDRDRSAWNFAAGVAGLRRITEAVFDLRPIVTGDLH